jgi:hypothetical protein
MSVRSRLEGTAEAPRVPEIEQTTVRERLNEEQDPSMPGIPTVAAPTTSLAPVEEPVVAPVVEPVVAEVPVAPVEVPEQRYTWQPTDENDKPIGGLQVILYRTEQEKFERMQEKSVLLLRQLRKERREKALGVEERVDDAEKFQGVVEFKSRDLTADERFKISQGIANPESFVDARDQLVESVFGAKPSVVASTLNEMQRIIVQQRAVENYIEFVNSTGFNDTPENRSIVTGWLGTRNLAPTVANFAIAQKRLKEAGLLQEAPVVQQEPVRIAPVTPVVTPVVTLVQEPKPQVPTTTSPALVTQESQATRHSHVPSGLNASVASPAGSIPVDGTSLTLADIDRMSSDDYKKRLRTVPGFAALVDKLEADAALRRRAKMIGQ